MNLPKLVVFDCDGVMFDSKPANRLYYDRILAEFGHPAMNDEDLEFVHTHQVSDSVRHIFRRFPDDLQRAEAFRQSLDYTPYLHHMVMEPDLPEFLRFLKPICKTAISTNRTNTMSSLLAAFSLTPLFDKVVTASDVSRPKPHPEALALILDYFGLSPEQTVYIGDSMVDREHTTALGVRLIAFKNPNLPAEFHVKSFMEIKDLPIFTHLSG